MEEGSSEAVVQDGGALSAPSVGTEAVMPAAAAVRKTVKMSETRDFIPCADASEGDCSRSSGSSAAMAGTLPDVASCTGSSEAAPRDDDDGADAEMHHTPDYTRRGAAGSLRIAPLELFSAPPSPPPVSRPPAKPAVPESAADDLAAAPEAGAGGGAQEEAMGRQIAQGAALHVVDKGNGGDCCGQLRQEYDSLLREKGECRRVLEDLMRENELKTKECHQAQASLRELQMELMRKSMHVGSLAFAVEGQVKEKTRWCQLLKDLSEKFKSLKTEHQILLKESEEYKKCLSDATQRTTTIHQYVSQYACLESEFKDLKEKFSEEAKERKDLYNKLIELKVGSKDQNSKLEKKRKAATADFGGKNFVRRSELEEKQPQKRRQIPAKVPSVPTPNSSVASDPTNSNTDPAQAGGGNPNPSSSSAAASVPPALAGKKATPEDTLHSEERRIDELVLPRNEVMRRLRVLREPVTLFGEDDADRLDRLKLVLKSGAIDDIDDLEMTEGQTNDFLRDMIELRMRQKAGRDAYGKGKGKRVGAGDGGEGGALGDDVDEGDGDDADADKDSKRMKTKFEELCDEDKILVFFKRLLNEWNQELDDMTKLEKRTAKGKSMFATFKQCARYLSPLFEFCRKKVLPDDIRKALLFIVDCCMKRDYLQAMDQYIKLAIGNAPWPIGVTMVGIHERSAREKIYTNNVAHIMNDETTRKYLQSIKRLMTLCQRRYPALPSKSVEFNSLANGSDLQALLSEEKDPTKGPSEDRLRLMPASKE